MWPERLVRGQRLVTGQGRSMFVPLVLNVGDADTLALVVEEREVLESAEPVFEEPTCLSADTPPQNFKFEDCGPESEWMAVGVLPGPNLCSCEMLSWWKDSWRWIPQ